MNTLILIRGLPGSGKSTLARRLIKAGFYHFEADQFFERHSGYHFDRAKLPEAHADCHARTIQALADGYDVVVSNTFTRLWEMRPYLRSARELGCVVFIAEARGSLGNTHGVPPEAVDAMRARWEPFVEEKEPA